MGLLNRKKKTETPKDLGLKLVSKEEALWQKVLDNATSQKLVAEESMIVQTAVINLATRKIQEAKIGFNATKATDITKR